MATITLSQLLKEMDRYIRKMFIEHISQFEPEYPKYTKSETWPLNDGGLFVPFIRDGEQRSILPAPVKAENAPIVAQDLYDGRTKDVYSVRFGTALSFSYEKQKMGIGRLNSAKKVSTFLTDSVRMTYEGFYAEMLDATMDTSPTDEFKSFDGYNACYTAHALLAGGTYSNRYADAASPTYGVINNIITSFARMVSEDNYAMPTARIGAFWVPPEEEACIFETLKSMGRPDTMVRADNIISSREAISTGPEGVKTLNYMSANQWLAVDPRLHSLTRYELEGPRIEYEYDTKTQGATWQVSFWIARALWGWRGLYGVPRA